VVRPKLQWKLERVANRKQRIFARLKSSTKVARLGDQSAAVQSNIAGDLARLEELKMALGNREATRGDVAESRHIRPAVYHRIINQVRLVTALLEQFSNAPVEVPAETPTEVPAETPVEVPAEVPAETPVEVPAETPGEVPAETPGEVPAETSTGTAVDVAQLEALHEKLLGYDATTLRLVLKEHQAEITDARGALEDEDTEAGEDTENIQEG
jgi:hypothetical protein